MNNKSLINEGDSAKAENVEPNNEREEVEKVKERERGNLQKPKSPVSTPFLPNIFFFINSSLWAAYGAQKMNLLVEVNFFCKTNSRKEKGKEKGKRKKGKKEKEKNKEKNKEN